MRSVRKVKILGYPFAGGQGKSGVELTPPWLQSQSWFKDLTNRSNGLIQYEEIKVSNPSSNLLQTDGDSERETDPKNIKNVLRSSIALRNQTYDALKQGFYPIILGGDHSQAIGSISGLKKMYPDAKILWLDAHIDANTPSSSPSQNMHGMPLAYLSGMIPEHREWKCMNMSTDICYFGIRSYEPEEHQLIQDKNVLVFESADCKAQYIKKIERELDTYFKRRNKHYWISFDIDAVDAKSFQSTGTAEEDGLTLDFVQNFFQEFAHKTVGMDFTEVNFELAPNLYERMNDEETFRHLLELITHSVNTTKPDFVLDEPLHVPQTYEPAMNQALLSSPGRLSRFFSVKNKKN